MISNLQYSRAGVIKVEGDLIGQRSQLLYEEAKQQLEAGNCDLIFDCATCLSVDSKGLEAFTDIQGLCEEKLGQVRFVGCSEEILEVFRVTRLLLDFECLDTVDEAIESLR